MDERDGRQTDRQTMEEGDSNRQVEKEDATRIDTQTGGVTYRQT